MLEFECNCTQKLIEYTVNSASIFKFQFVYLLLGPLLQSSEVQILSSATHEYRSLMNSKSSAFDFRNSQRCFVALHFYMLMFSFTVNWNVIRKGNFFFSVALRRESGSWPPHYQGFTITFIGHTTLGRTPLDK